MTDFAYVNEPQVRKLSEELCTNGEVRRSYEKQSREVCKFLISYWIISGKRIHPMIYERIRTQLIYAECSKDNIIFFEKLNSVKIDTAYFENYMRQKETDTDFRDHWYAYFC